MILAAALVLSSVPRQDSFDELFTGRCQRFDYQHVGTAGQEHVAPEGFRLEAEWPGSRTQLVDRSNLGLYLFEVRGDDGTTLYSRGFASIFGEWQTTGEAREAWRSFHESQRFPEPKAPVRLALSKRGDDGAFRELWTGALDPAGRTVDRSALAAESEVIALFEHGPPASQVDLLVVAEGYTAQLREKFVRDARRLTEALFATEPFARRRQDFNLRLLFRPSPEAGISNPRQGVWPRTSFGLSFNAFDSDRYVLTFENEELREATAQAPYDALILLFHARKYGGGGIFNLWATCAADTEPAAYVFVHELGHSFAGLADEYYTSQVAYEDFVKPGNEPWEPNVTALLDPRALKWRDLVDDSTPLPTPWVKQRYEELSIAFQEQRAKLREAGAGEEEMEALFRADKAQTQPLLAGDPAFGKVGAFEGAAYQALGLYRPEVDCIMFTRNPSSFCRVCERAIEGVIDLYAR